MTNPKNMYMHIIRLAIMLFKKFYYIFDIGSLRTTLEYPQGFKLYTSHTKLILPLKYFRINIVYIQIDVLCDLFIIW